MRDVTLDTTRERWYNLDMTTTKTTSAFDFVRDGESYSGTPLYRVVTPAGEEIGRISSGGRRSTVWAACPPGCPRSVGGFRNREEAARYLLRVAEETS